MREGAERCEAGTGRYAFKELAAALLDSSTRGGEDHPPSGYGGTLGSLTSSTRRSRRSARRLTLSRLPLATKRGIVERRVV